MYNADDDEITVESEGWREAKKKQEEISRLRAELENERKARAWAEERVRDCPCVVPEHETLRAENERIKGALRLLLHSHWNLYMQVVPGGNPENDIIRKQAKQALGEKP